MSFENHANAIILLFFFKCRCPNHERFAKTNYVINVTGGRAAPSSPSLYADVNQKPCL